MKNVRCKAANAKLHTAVPHASSSEGRTAKVRRAAWAGGAGGRGQPCVRSGVVDSTEGRELPEGNQKPRRWAGRRLRRRALTGRRRPSCRAAKRS